MAARGRVALPAGYLAAAVLVVTGLPAVPTAGATFEGRDGLIAWTRDGDIFTMRADGTGRRRLTENPRWETAQWSPDGRRLAVRQERAEAEQRERILLMDGDGANRSVLTRVRYSVQSMTWSPDGRRIAYCDLDVSRPDEAAPYPSAIMVVDVRTGTKRRITDEADRACGPSWSPDGNWIAYVAGDAADTEVEVMRADGSEPRVVLADPDQRQVDVAWGPTGETIAFVTLVDQPGGDATSRLETVLADGTGRAVLADSPEGSVDRVPEWSPDGAHVLFSRRARAVLPAVDRSLPGAAGGRESRRDERADGVAPSGRGRCGLVAELEIAGGGTGGRPVPAPRRRERGDPAGRGQGV